LQLDFHIEHNVQQLLFAACKLSRFVFALHRIISQKLFLPIRYDIGEGKVIPQLRHLGGTGEGVGRRKLSSVNGH
jgi:hypothetical protein